MQTDPAETVERFLHALSPASREVVRQLPRDQQEMMAASWERHLRDDTSLLTLSELDPASAEHRAAEDVVQDLL
ncbi:hypothetical protein AQJ43_35840 [Streptomyces avermitilis]|uniref:Uncharacterized protein n=1 Tax=Streptomyces avermitilis TaxID=33903 RepID=A0A4D4MB06_STRAX|nr:MULTISPECIES: hypothetical protein [Streptomyces]KUN49691.1 hypothetical protein AQJ43_35840 [Streptomyces avermitilis]MYS95785.1 hypothetical protein [Streptomyces sp. SID5469]OOV24844.1 hypothetical protein SM007_28930 [Streptomyces avermitilis]BBJ47429.1 hypothetical protein SAVMC3_00580 [Streptomyces avermitilis]GDY69045.1 hypothetical protein SAV14893_084380 [Streptomyces avermitilis]